MNKLFCALVALGLAARLGATTYYVSNAGSDSNAGTSTALPWATAGKVNGAALSAGDVVSFQAGGIWREQLLPKSGNSTSKITYNSYGSGPKPLFLGSVSANTTAQWTSLGSNQWATANGSFPTDIGNINLNNPSYVANPSFNSDTLGWSFYVNTAAGASATFARNTATYDSAPASGAISVVSNGASANDLQLFRGDLSVTAGKLYRLTFRAKASSAFTMPQPSIMKQSSPYSSYYSATSSWTGSVTTSWATFTIDFTTSVNANDMKVNFSLGNAVPDGATFYIDDIFLWDVTDNASKITNPSFATDLSTWSTFNAGTASATSLRNTSIYDSVPASCAIAVTNKGTSTSDIQFCTSNLSIVSGKVYRLTFAAKATTAVTGIAKPVLIKQTSPYTTYTSSVGAFAGTVSTTWDTYIIDYTANVTAGDARLSFCLGNSVPNGATLYIDDITFTEVFPHPAIDVSLQNAYMAIFKKANSTDLTTQDDFWYDAANQRVVMYSTANPASLYATIECAVGTYQLYMDTKSYVEVNGLAFWNGAKDCVHLRGSNHVTVKNCDLRYIGGAYTNPTDHLRFGNALSIWNTGQYIWFTNNYAENIYDAGLSPQGTSTNQQDHLYFRYNAFIACEMSYELWDRPTTSTTNEIYFEYNICRDAGKSWSHGERPAYNGSHILLGLNESAATNIFIRYNTFDTATNKLVFHTAGTFNDIASVTIDYNTYRQNSGGTFAIWHGDTFDCTNSATTGFPAYQTLKDFLDSDLHSTLTTY
jgi:hypothetical protein